MDEEGDELFPDLNNLSNRTASTSASTSKATSTFDFPLDPSLFGPGLGGNGQYLNEGYEDEDEDEDDDEGDDSLDEDGEDDSSEDETDAEDEYRAGFADDGASRGVKRGRSSVGEVNLAMRKGKGKHTELLADVGGAEEGGEEELGRLIHAIRESATASGGGRAALEKEFDRSIEEEMEALDEALGGSGKRRGGKRSNGRRPAAEAEPSHEVKHLMSRANTHYINGEHDAAEELLTEIVRIDPSLRSPWYTLATIQEEKGDKERAVMFKIVAAHLQSTKNAAKEWAELGEQSRDIGLLQQAIYCFSQAIKGDKSDVDSMWDRAVLLKMSGNSKQAITAFTSLLSIHPHDPGVLRELAPLLATDGAYARASALYLASYNYFRTSVPHITSTDEISHFSSQDLEALADYLLVQRDFKQVVSVVKEGTRWLQGREKETGWDKLDDDREFDEIRKVRRGWEKDARFLEEAEVYELDVRLRVRLGVARLGLGDVDEAASHFAIVLQEDVAEFPQLFGAIADAYFDDKMYAEALEVYQDMAENEETNGPPVWIKVAQCYQSLGDLNDAKECYEAVAEAEPDNLISKLQLAKVYEQLNDPTRALETINSVIESQRRIREADPAGAKDAPPQRGARRPKADRAIALASEEQRHQEFAIAFQKLSLIDAKVQVGQDGARAEWLEVATYLVDAFRETRQLFPTDGKRKFTGMLSRNWRRKGAGENDIDLLAGEMVSRLERTMNTGNPAELEEKSFRGLDFDGWLILIITYAFYLAKNGEFEAAQETLLHVQWASVFKQSASRRDALQLAYVACCLRANSITGTLQGIRTLWLRNQFQTHPLRLLQAVLSGGGTSAEALRESTLQKFVIRQLKQIDDIVRGAETKLSRGMVVLVDNKGKEKEEDGDGAVDDDEASVGSPELNKFTPTKMNPVYLFAYGAMLMVTGSFQSAIIYLLRAYEIAPEQPLINLSLAVAYLHRALSRQSDNRQHQIAQALAFLSQYRNFRGPCQEVEYNFGRLFHHLGLHSHAVKHYSAVLKLASEQMESEEEFLGGVGPKADFSKVAAYNLSLIYALAGNEQLSREIVTKWLAV